MTRPVDGSSAPSITPTTTAAPSSTAAKENQTSGSSTPPDAVSLSPNGRAAQLMAQAATTPSPDPALDQIAKDIASDIYRPPPKAIAEALVRFETALLKGKP